MIYLNHEKNPYLFLWKGKYLPRIKTVMKRWEVNGERPQQHKHSRLVSAPHLKESIKQWARVHDPEQQSARCTGLAERCCRRATKQALPGLVSFQFLKCDKLFLTSQSLCLVDTFTQWFFMFVLLMTSGLSFLYSTSKWGAPSSYLLLS